MPGTGNEKLLRKYRILVAPLDWGLGHATRCIPIIRELLEKGCEVWLAGEGAQESLLKKEFPDLSFLALDGYRVQYARNPGMFLIMMIMQVPRIIATIRKERKWLAKMIKSHGFDAVISDNRFGLYNSRIHSVFVTHQLAIKTPWGPRSERLLRGWNYRFINRFDQCWVPDVENDQSLAGELSHPAALPKAPVRYIGLLSRFDEVGLSRQPGTQGHLLFLLSGPEPQRTIFENRIIDEVSHYSGTATIVRGLPTVTSIIPSTNMIKFYNHLPAKELVGEIGKAEWIISRSGYSTVMDLVRLKKKMILVPTPGQTEQEYLAKYLSQNHIAASEKQEGFSLDKALNKARSFDFRVLELATPPYISELLDLLGKDR